MSFLGVYKALYDFTPESEGELRLEEGDILYLLEKSDVDDWWTVKKRIVGPDVDEPTGLVPSNYVTEADIIGTATALYDYDKQTEEELTFKENDQFQVFDDKDPDWILVSKNNQEFGFVPSNYIEIRKGENGVHQPGAILPPPTHPSLATTNVQAEASKALQPPPQRVDSQPAYNEPEEEEQPPLPVAKEQSDSDYRSAARDSYRKSSYDDHYDDEEEAPPPKPTRPGQSSSSSRRPSYYESEPSSSRRVQQEEDEDEKLYTWQVSEVEGRKKKKAMLAIGNSTIYFSPDSVKGNSSPQQWKIKDLLSFSHEKKHVFLEFRNPLYSLEIHAGSKDVASEIVSILGELKGSVSSSGLKEVKAAASSSVKKLGKVLYNFEAQGDDELTVYEGDVVTIINDHKSKDWWMVENKSGRRGVVPAQFVEPTKESLGSSFASKFKLSRSKSKENLKSPSKSSPSKSTTTESPTKRLAGPKPSRVRTWEDRSGTFKVDAEFLGVVEGKIHLHKTNGVKIAVAAPKLSLVDLEYVERVTGMSLENYKTPSSSSRSKSSDHDEQERRERKERERKRREREEKIREKEDRERQRERDERERDRREREYEREERERLRRELDETKRLAAEAKRAVSDIPPAQPARPTSSTSTRDRSNSAASKPAYDWFEFFLEAGVDVNQCQRYTTNFQKEQIDPSIIESIDAGILRTLGLREGDIIRVTRYLDQKFNRQPAESHSTGGLFSEPSGALKVNRTGPASQVGGSLPSPSKVSKDDDAWTVKPAANNEVKDTGSSSPLVNQQFTGSMQDLVNLKPLQPTATASSVRSNTQTYAPTTSKPLQPTVTGASAIPSQKTGEMTAQPTGIALDPFKTGGGNILPLSTGGAYVYLPIQQTGFIGIQPTGLVPLQKTGGLPSTFTGGLVPLQKTGGLQSTITGGLPSTVTGGLVPLQRTGGLPLQPTGLIPLQKTGQQLTPGLTGGLPQFGALPPTTFGQLPSTTFGQLPPTTSFGALPASLTGQRTGFGAAQATGGISATPLNTFQPTGGIPPTSFNSQPLGFNQQPTGFNQQPNFFSQTTGFNQQQPGFGQPQSTFNSLSSPPTGFTQQPSFNQQLNQLTTGFQNTSLQQQPFNTGFQPQQQQQLFNPGFQPQAPPQPSFGGFQPQAQPQSSFGGFQPQAQPQTSFGGFQQQQLLEAQPTGFGFGNSASSFGQTQQQQFGQRANLANASADNPFGF